MSLNKLQTITTMPPSHRPASLPDVRIKYSTAISPQEPITPTTLEAGTKPCAHSPAQGPTINTTPSSLPLPKCPDEQQLLQGPTGLPVLLVPAAEERLRPIQQVSHGLLGYGHSYEYQSLQAAPVLQLPEITKIPNTVTPVLLEEGVEGLGEGIPPLCFLNLSPPISAGQDSGLGSSVFDIDITPAGTAGDQGADIELQTYPRGHGGHGRPRKGDSTDSKRHPDGPHHARSNRKLSLASFLIAAGLVQKPSEVSLNTQPTINDTDEDRNGSPTTLDESALHTAISSQIPTSQQHSTKMASLAAFSGPFLSHCPFISTHLNLTTRVAQLSTNLMINLNQLRKDIATMTGSTTQRYASYPRLRQYQMDLEKLEGGVRQVKRSFETLVGENRLQGQPAGVMWVMENNLGELEERGREARRLWEKVGEEWQEMAKVSRWGWLGVLRRGCCGM
jgi:hypothetical protein